MNHLITITKSDGTRQLFEQDKLVRSLKRVGASDRAIEEVVDQVEKGMKDGMTTNEIYGFAFSLLRKNSVHVAVKYSIRRALAELGPDGFPFEKFVARVFNEWGYEAVTDQQVMGVCIPHEMDVVAWKGDTLAMVEAKFHNELVLKSDVKVALYIKARFDDIQGNVFEYGGVKRSLKERWLFTNTKFTDQAVKYGACNNLNLIGWNYPVGKNLHTIIEEHKLHPVTCITSLTHQQKMDLVGRNIIVCADVIKNPKILNDIGVRSEDEVQKIIEEAKLILSMTPDTLHATKEDLMVA
ncbi:MAG: ATP cone domain-containing protein [bacterium]|nr:ATP cone domain-containing protein [bacterium]